MIIIVAIDDDDEGTKTNVKIKGLSRKKHQKKVLFIIIVLKKFWVNISKFFWDIFPKNEVVSHSQVKNYFAWSAKEENLTNSRFEFCLFILA